MEAERDEGEQDTIKTLPRGGGAADGGAGGDNSSDDEMIASKQLTAADFSESVELHGGRVVHLTMRLGAKNFARLFSDEGTGSHLWPCSRDLSNLRKWKNNGGFDASSKTARQTRRIKVDDDALAGWHERGAEEAR